MKANIKKILLGRGFYSLTVPYTELPDQYHDSFKDNNVLSSQEVLDNHIYRYISEKIITFVTQDVSKIK